MPAHSRAQGRWSPSRGLSLSQVSQQWGLRLRQRTLSDRIELVGNAIHISLVPGLRHARVGNRTVALTAPIQYYRGELMVPREVVQALPVLTPRQKTKAISGVASSRTIILDPGHGGRDPGAIGYGGIREKDVNLAVSLRIRQILQARGVRVLMTRSGDTFPSLHQRADLANRTPNSIFISIHAKAVGGGNQSANGVETFILSSRISDAYRAKKASAKYSVKPENGEWIPRSRQKAHIQQISQTVRGKSTGLAQSIHGRMVQASGQVNRGIRRKNLHVLRESFFSPAVLLEVGFLTHPATARKLRTATYRNRIADGIAQGILEHLARTPDQTYASRWKRSTDMTIVRR
jgi:N-acetylmuramoyl-L-alanine amidase